MPRDDGIDFEDNALKEGGNEEQKYENIQSFDQSVEQPIKSTPTEQLDRTGAINSVGPQIGPNVNILVQNMDETPQKDMAIVIQQTEIDIDPKEPVFVREPKYDVFTILASSLCYLSVIPVLQQVLLSRL